MIIQEVTTDLYSSSNMELKSNTFSILYVVQDSSFSVCRVLAKRFGSLLLHVKERRGTH